MTPSPTPAERAARIVKEELVCACHDYRPSEPHASYCPLDPSVAACIAAAISAAVAEEREACAMLMRGLQARAHNYSGGQQAAFEEAEAAIRARAQQPKETT